MFKKWIARYRKRRFMGIMASQLEPKWLFDKGNYLWFPQKGRKIMVSRDQLGNWIVFDGIKMASGYLKTSEEGKKFAIEWIVDEILRQYYPNFTA